MVTGWRAGGPSTLLPHSPLARHMSRRLPSVAEQRSFALSTVDVSACCWSSTWPRSRGGRCGAVFELFATPCGFALIEHRLFTVCFTTVQVLAKGFPMTRRVAVGGQPEAIEFAMREFAGSERRVERDGDGHKLVAPELRPDIPAEDLCFLGANLVEEMNGALRLLRPSFSGLEIQGVREPDTSGVEQTTNFGKASMVTAGVICEAYGYAGHGPPPPPPESAAKKLMRLGDPNIDFAFVRRMLAKKDPDWVSLYKLFEVVRNDCAARARGMGLRLDGGYGAIEHFGFAPFIECVRFNETACEHGGSGDNARHAPRQVTLNHPPMSLAEGREWIRALVLSWLGQFW